MVSAHHVAPAPTLHATTVAPAPPPGVHHHNHHQSTHLAMQQPQQATPRMAPQHSVHNHNHHVAAMAPTPGAIHHHGQTGFQRPPPPAPQQVSHPPPHAAPPIPPPVPPPSQAQQFYPVQAAALSAPAVTVGGHHVGGLPQSAYHQHSPLGTASTISDQSNNTKGKGLTNFGQQKNRFNSKFTFCRKNSNVFNQRAGPF